MKFLSLKIARRIEANPEFEYQGNDFTVALIKAKNNIRARQEVLVAAYYLALFLCLKIAPNGGFGVG